VNFFFDDFVSDSIAYRMIYALSNAGANPNVVDENGNTSLHAALTRDFIDIGLDFIQVKTNLLSLHANSFLKIFLRHYFVLVSIHVLLINKAKQPIHISMKTMLN